MQYGGCGHQGHSINVPRPFLLFNQTAELDTKTESLLAEMIKFKYGVFEETGFPHDSMYPETYTTGNETLATEGCEDGQRFCGLAADYNRFAPSKQNILCNGRSVMEMVSHHLNNATRNVTSPTVNYVTMESSRYVLVLDLAHDSNTWTSINKALYRFISMIPEGASLAIVHVQPDSDTTVLLPTVVTMSRREGLHGLIPRRSAETRGCVECGVATAAQLLGQSPGTIVIVSGSAVSAPLQHQGINKCTESMTPLHLTISLRPSLVF